MEKTIFAATSADGFIARLDGSEDFLSDANWLFFTTLARECGNFIVGRKTYESVRDWDEGINFDTLSDITRVVVTRERSFEAPGFLVADSPHEAASRLESAGFTRALIIGGSELNTSFFREGLVDNIVLSIEPASIGTGIPLFADSSVMDTFNLVSSESLPDGRVINRYIRT